jgi:hypothetical protein
MKHLTLKVLLWLVTALALLYAAAFVYGVVLVGFRAMIPWVSPGCGLISLALALLTTRTAAECTAIAFEMRQAG